MPQCAAGSGNNATSKQIRISDEKTTGPVKIRNVILCYAR